MSKLKIDYITAYKRMSAHSSITYASQVEVVKFSHTKKEVIYIIPMGEGRYECESHFCNVMSESEFNKEYALERIIK